LKLREFPLLTDENLDPDVVTHDADFGTLAILQNEPLVGIVYLRPGHIDAQFTVATFQAVLPWSTQMNRGPCN
jgi:hypothetical protein